MDGERPSGLVVVAAAVEIGREGWDEVGAVELVVVEQPAEPVGDEAFDLGGILFDREDARYAEIRIGSGAVGFAGLLSRCQRSPSLGERARDLLGCESGPRRWRPDRQVVRVRGTDRCTKEMSTPLWAKITITPRLRATRQGRRCRAISLSNLIDGMIVESFGHGLRRRPGDHDDVVWAGGHDPAPRPVPRPPRVSRQHRVGPRRGHGSGGSRSRPWPVDGP